MRTVMPETKTKRRAIGILGAGAFGTALAMVYRKKFNVTLFSCFGNHVISMRTSRINEFFNEVVIPEVVQIEATEDLSQNRFDYLLWAFPIKPTQEILNKLKSKIDGTDIVICSKGLLPDSTFVCDFFQQELTSSRVGYLSGPNFAIELASDKISAADIASTKLGYAVEFAEGLSTDQFKIKAIDDIVGIQIAGAIKNIIAIASGIAYGLDLGENAHAALMTMALTEMKNFGLRLGAKESTFYGLCGLGDLLLTASSQKSRNTSLGIEISKQNFAHEILDKATYEGYDTVQQVVELAKKNGIKMPICETVYNIIFDNCPPSSIVDVFK